MWYPHLGPNVPLTLTLNFDKYINPIIENYDNQRTWSMIKIKLIRDSNNELNILLNKDNIENLYHNFITTLSISIHKFTVKVWGRKENRITNHWYDSVCKHGRKFIRDDSIES